MLFTFKAKIMRKIIITFIAVLSLSTVVNAKSHAEIKQEWKGFVEKRVETYKADIEEVLPSNINKVFRSSKDTYVYRNAGSYYEVTVVGGKIIEKSKITKSKFNKNKKLCLMRITKFWLKKNRLDRSDLLN